MFWKKYHRSVPFTLIDLDIPSNSYMIACTNTQSFVEEKENCASTISVEHLKPLFHTLGSNMALFGSKFKFQEPLVMLLVVLINFGVKNHAPQVSFKFVVGDSMSVFSHEFDDIKFCESLDILEAILYYGAQGFSLHVPNTFLPSYMITCSSPHNTSKDGDILHSPGHLLLTPKSDFTSNGSMFKAATYKFLGFTSHGSNSQALFLSHQLISVALHGSIFHLAVVYVPDSVEHIPLLPKRKITPYIINYIG